MIEAHDPRLFLRRDQSQMTCKDLGLIGCIDLRTELAKDFEIQYEFQPLVRYKSKKQLFSSKPYTTCLVIYRITDPPY